LSVTVAEREAVLVAQFRDFDRSMDRSESKMGNFAMESREAAEDVRSWPSC
jgi:hypothetical protein